MFFVQILSAPFALTNPQIDSSLIPKVDWVGSVQTEDIAVYIDNLLLLILGGIPWQVPSIAKTSITKPNCNF